MPDIAVASAKRPPHVVGVADVGDGATFHVPEDLAQGQQVGQGLAGMGPVREQVHHRHRTREPGVAVGRAGADGDRSSMVPAMRVRVEWSSTTAHSTAW